MSEWIAVCGEEGANPIEVETEEDGTLLLEELTALFPGTTTLKYRNKDSNAYRSVKCSKGVLKAPGGSWDQAPIYICVNPTKAEATGSSVAAPAPSNPMKRTHAQAGMGEPTGQADQAKRMLDNYDPLKCTDLIVLGLKPTTSAAVIKEYFETFGEVVMCQTKNSRDKNVAFAFIKFSDKQVERKVMKIKHPIEERECTVRIPDSQQGDRSMRKIYVSYHDKDVTESDLTEHFEKYGDVVEVFIPNPWRHFAFVTFYDGRIAQSLIGKEHDLNGVSLLIKSAGNSKKDQQQQQQGDPNSDYANMFRKMGEGDGGYGNMGGYGNQQGAWGGQQGGHWQGMQQGNMGGNMGGGNMAGGPNMGGNMGPNMPNNPMMGGGPNMGPNYGGAPPNMGGGGPNMGGGGNMGPGMGQGGQMGGNMGGPPPNSNMGQGGYGGNYGNSNYGNYGNNQHPLPVPPPQQGYGGGNQQQQSSGSGGSGGYGSGGEKSSRGYRN